MTQIDKQALLEAARSAQEKAYAPYSGFHVGAAILDSNGNVHHGCNVENSAYPQGLCAEANAIGQMVTAGGGRIVAIAVVGVAVDDGKFANAGECTPCGGCRQRILEFSDDATSIVLCNSEGETVSYSVDELLPHSFRSNVT